MKRAILHFFLVSTFGLTNALNHDQIIIFSEKNSYSIDHSIPKAQLSSPSSNVHSGIRTNSNSFAQHCQERYEQHLNKKILEQQLLYHCQQNGIDFAWARYYARGVAEHCIHINFLNGPEWSPQCRKPSDLPLDFVDEFGCWAWIKPWEDEYSCDPFFAQEKMLNSLHGLCKYTNKKLTNYVRDNPLAHPEHFLMTADGQLVQAFNELPHAHFMEGQPASAKPKQIKYPPIPTEGPLWHFSEEAIEIGVRHVMERDKHHSYF